MKTLSKRRKLRHVYKRPNSDALDHGLVGDGGVKWGVDGARLLEAHMVFSSGWCSSISIV
jgi:hypothetical protein